MSDDITITVPVTEAPGTREPFGDYAADGERWIWVNAGGREVHLRVADIAAAVVRTREEQARKPTRNNAAYAAWIEKVIAEDGRLVPRVVATADCPKCSAPKGASCSPCALTVHPQRIRAAFERDSPVLTDAEMAAHRGLDAPTHADDEPNPETGWTRAEMRAASSPATRDFLAAMDKLRGGGSEADGLEAFKAFLRAEHAKPVTPAR